MRIKYVLCVIKHIRILRIHSSVVQTYNKERKQGEMHFALLAPREQYAYTNNVYVDERKTIQRIDPFLTLPSTEYLYDCFLPSLHYPSS